MHTNNYAGPLVRGLPRRILTFFTFAVLMMTIQTSVGAPQGDLAEFQRQTRLKYDLKEAAFSANDPEPILTRFYHPEAISTGPDGHTLVGRAELRPVYEKVISGDVRVESYRSFVSGDAGWDWVNFHVTPPAASGQAPFTFKMLFLWQQENGEWWSHGEMYVNGEFDIK